jgi:hypothetical protein
MGEHIGKRANPCQHRLHYHRQADYYQEYKYQPAEGCQNVVVFHALFSLLILLLLLLHGHHRW